MLGLATGMMPGRQVVRNQKSACRKNQNNEAYIACAQWEQCLRDLGAPDSQQHQAYAARQKRFVATGPNRKAISSACQRGPAALLRNIALPMRDNTKLGGRDNHSPGDGEA